MWKRIDVVLQGLCRQKGRRSNIPPDERERETSETTISEEGGGRGESRISRALGERRSDPRLAVK